MNRKGFTLIEMLGVIALLSIIMVVASPVVFRYLTQSKDKTYNTYVRTLYNATRTYFEKNSMYIPAQGEYTNIKAKTLKDEGYIDALIDATKRSVECDYDNSYVHVENLQSKEGTKVRNNAKLRFTVTLVCPSKTLKNIVMNTDKNDKNSFE